MSGEIITTIVGGLAEAPELRFTPSGAAVCKLRVASTSRKLDRQKNEWVESEATWVSVTAWRTLAENIAGSDFKKGDRVICYGSLANRQWEDREGGTRYSLEMEAFNVGPDLTWRVAPIQDGVHTGAGERKKATPKQDPFESATTERPAAQQANADTQRANQGASPAPW